MTGRDLHADTEAEIVKDGVRPMVLAELEFKAETVRFWSGVGELTWDSRVWTGTGALTRISATRETHEIRADNLTLGLNGVDSAIVAIARDAGNDGYQRRPARVYLGFMDAAGAVIADPFQIFAGRMDTMELLDARDQSAVTLTIENRLIDLTRARVRRYTAEDQHRDFPADTGLDGVAALQDAQIVWGRT